jgi:hypothetical protein
VVELVRIGAMVVMRWGGYVVSGLQLEVCFAWCFAVHRAWEAFYVEGRLGFLWAAAAEDV